MTAVLSWKNGADRQPGEADPGESWQWKSHLVCKSHEYLRNGTARMLTLFHPATGKVQVNEGTSSTNAILFSWLKGQIKAILQTLPEKTTLNEETNRQLWYAWQQSLAKRITLAKTASFTDVIDLGQSSGTLHPLAGYVVVCTWSYAVIQLIG